MPTDPTTDPAESSTAALTPPLSKLMLGAIGVVFGDIATSPLYAFQEAFRSGQIAPSHDNILGLLSLVFWALVLVVGVKYVVFVMRADNQGEGGMIALSALAHSTVRQHRRTARVVMMVGLAGAALFFGDSVITPAISVLSAVEGLKLRVPALSHWVLPLGVVIIVLLFLMQKSGSGLVGVLFGPIMALWMVTIAALGVAGLIDYPHVLRALDPRWAVHYMQHNGFAGFASLGAVVLVMTGAEALYADIGHFGVPPIRYAWFGFAFPALVLNYFGQGALLMRHGYAVSQPFYLLAPDALLYPLIALATLATVIASQAVISGTFSMVRQAIQLGYLPRTRVRHTSGHMEGQIYLPTVNYLLLAAVLAAAIGFGASERLAGAYGIAVSGTMVLTTLLILLVARERWKWGWLRLGAFALVYVVIDVALFGANLLKIDQGGWFPLALAAAMLIMMIVWRRGATLLSWRVRAGGEKLEDFIAHLQEEPILRVPGTAVFLTGDPEWAPRALRLNVQHNHVLHDRNLVLTVSVLDQPRADFEERNQVEDLGFGFWRVQLNFGFAERMHVPGRMRQLPVEPRIDPAEIVWFESRERVRSGKGIGMSRWRVGLFSFLARNATSATVYYGIPSEQLVEIGASVEL
ncbi:MAG: potassium transporter Kup [Burkholderiaceae bacterium]|nr:MAG: potassium transporter Kup [Burkholderiaceae bacterium]